MRPSFLSIPLCAGAFFCLSSGSVFAQQRSLSIREAVSLTREQQPQLRAQQEQANAAAYNVGLAKNTLLPDLTASYQAGYATYNNMTGMTYPGGFLPISGPPSAGNTYDAVPGSVLSALLKWNPLTFGQRQAAVEKAAAQYQVAASQYNDALFRQQYTVIATYLDAVYLRSLTASYEANIARTATGLNQALVLAKEGLRPGIDTATAGGTDTADGAAPETFGTATDRYGLFTQHPGCPGHRQRNGRPSTAAAVRIEKGDERSRAERSTTRLAAPLRCVGECLCPRFRCGGGRQRG